MEKFEFKEDVEIICNTVTTFPNHIKEAFDTLQESLPNCENRNWYGISRPNEKGVIIYKAAATELEDGEAEQFGYDSFTIKKGTYISETITDWMKQPQVIGETFMKLLEDPRIDKDGYCLEWYKNDDEVICMVGIET